MLVTALVGFLFGFVGAMPVAGPIAVLVFTRGVEGRFRSGLFIAVGASMSEQFYACLAFWGFSTFLARYEWVVPVSRALAAAILAALGLVLARHRGGAHAESPARENAAGSFFLGFSICALNPTFLATWTAATATLFSTGLVDFEPWLAVPFALSVALGSVTWFGVLLALLRRYRGRFRQKTLDRIVRAMGIFLIGVAVVFAVHFVGYLVG